MRVPIHKAKQSIKYKGLTPNQITLRMDWSFFLAIIQAALLDIYVGLRK